MELSISTPALLFSTVSLLFIAYTNRFVSLSNLVRGLKIKYQESRQELYIKQILNLGKRIIYIRNMQLLGILSLMMSIISIFLLIFGFNFYALIAFCIGLVCLFLSLIIAAMEIFISVDALKIELSTLKQ